MSIRGILFDKDGTLIDHAQTWVPAMDAALAALEDWTGESGLAPRYLEAAGHDPTLGRPRPGSLLSGGANDELAELWAGMSGLADTDDIAGRLVQIMEVRAADDPVPLFDVPALVVALRQRGLVLGIATMDAEWVAERTLDGLGVREEVAFVAGYDSGYGIKPEPGMVHAFCHAASLPPDMVMVVGDTQHDMMMAKNAGAGLAVGVRSGVGAGLDIGALADHMLDDARGVLGLLAE